ncbi:hypothetical protein COV93_05875 [Candidatus Woesearchaeota archaeon CG11_big_fil_rev_8_21_14_0_20_43_8]|nr:MAG: hypothetical protein COV93_05875 [Candidatus Woesearchaeota archaeon CG11_big_fil_rev_8_21_14_0_20_43_8]
MKRGDIWIIEFPKTKGREQCGKRPAIVLADSNPKIAVSLPLTSKTFALRITNSQ